MKTFLTFITVSFLIVSCRTIKTTENLFVPQKRAHKIEKVLVVGLSSNEAIRKTFENSMVYFFAKKGIKASTSIDYFSSKNGSLSLNEKIDFFKEELSSKGYTTIVISKVTGKDEKPLVLRELLEIQRRYEISDNIALNQGFSSSKKFNELFFTETSIYCMCYDTPKKILWKTSIEVVKKPSTEISIKRFSKHLSKEITRWSKKL